MIENKGLVWFALLLKYQMSIKREKNQSNKVIIFLGRKFWKFLFVDFQFSRKVFWGNQISFLSSKLFGKLEKVPEVNMPEIFMRYTYENGKTLTTFS